MTMAAPRPDTPTAPFAFLKDDVQTQRRVAGHLLDHVERLDQLLASSTAALGIDEVKFLRALRERLVVDARALAENANATSAAATEALTRATPEQA